MADGIKILVVDDEYVITENLKYALEKSGYIAYTATNGKDGLALFRQENPALVVLDVKMPGMNGLELLDVIKKDSPETLVIMLTTQGLDCQVEDAIYNGADDYLVKQTSPSVVVAKVTATLRIKNRCSSGDNDVISHGVYTAMLKGNRIAIDSTTLECTLHEFNLMCALIKHPHFVHKRDDLLDAVYGEETRSDRSIDQLVKRIRGKAKDAGVGFDPIHTVPTIGYQLGGN